MKTPRFLKEYAIYCIKEIKNCGYFDEEVIEEKTEKISTIVKWYERGYISVHEAMSQIMRA